LVINKLKLRDKKSVDIIIVEFTSQYNSFYILLGQYKGNINLKGV